MDSTSDGVTAGLMDPRLGSLCPDRLRQMTQKKLSQGPLADRGDQSVYVTVLRQEINRFDQLLGPAGNHSHIALIIAIGS